MDERGIFCEGALQPTQRHYLIRSAVMDEKGFTLVNIA